MDFFSPYLTIFITGLLTGGVSCVAVQGGLLTAISANAEKRRMILLTLFFLAGKIFAYSLLGGFLGLFGSVVQFSPTMSAVAQIVASLFMLGVAGNLLHLHPWFRYVLIQPPTFITRFVRKQSRLSTWFTPVFVGALTIFLPCGTTQAMMIQSVTSGSFVSGALTLFIFTLGTAPLFLLLGIVLHTASTAFSGWFTKIAAVMVIGLALWNLTNVFVVLGFAPGQILQKGVCQIVYCEEGSSTSSVVSGEKVAATTTPIITIRSTKYEVDNPTIPAGKEISLTVKNVDGNGCIQAFMISSLKIFKIIPVGKSETFTFTAPSTPGDLLFSCSMGMYRGVLKVRSEK